MLTTNFDGVEIVTEGGQDIRLHMHMHGYHFPPF